MRCEEVNPLLDAYADGELDLVHALEIDQHLTTCAACAARVERIAAVRDAVGSAGLRFAAPPQLTERIGLLVPAAPRRSSSQSSFRRPFAWQSWAAAAALLAAVLLGWGLMRWQASAAGQDRVAQEVVSNHIRSLLAEHLFDVASTDQHTVKPWFAGRVDFPPVVEDFADQGMPLVGGRVDVLDGRRVAALVYRKGKHVINLFMCPPVDGRAAAEQPRTTTYNGFNVVSWASPEMSYWAVSDANAAALQEFVTLWQGQATK